MWPVLYEVALFFRLNFVALSACFNIRSVTVAIDDWM
jgi:hypothetical protein